MAGPFALAAGWGARKLGQGILGNTLRKGINVWGKGIDKIQDRAKLNFIRGNYGTNPSLFQRGRKRLHGRYMNRDKITQDLGVAGDIGGFAALSAIMGGDDVARHAVQGMSAPEREALMRQIYYEL